MEKVVKLSAKRLEVMKQLLAQKAQLNQAFQQLNEKEGIIVSLVMEDNDITNVKSVKLENDALVFELAEPKAKKVKAAKTSAKVVPIDK